MNIGYLGPHQRLIYLNRKARLKLMKKESQKNVGIVYL
jgi:hypothetical protein